MSFEPICCAYGITTSFYEIELKYTYIYIYVYKVYMFLFRVVTDLMTRMQWYYKLYVSSDF